MPMNQAILTECDVTEEMEDQLEYIMLADGCDLWRDEETGEVYANDGQQWYRCKRADGKMY